MPERRNREWMERIEDLGDHPPRDLYEMIEELQDVPAYEGALEVAWQMGFEAPRSPRERALREALLIFMARLCPTHQDEVLDAVMASPRGGDHLDRLLWLEADAGRGYALERISARRESLEVVRESLVGPGELA